MEIRREENSSDSSSEAEGKFIEDLLRKARRNRKRDERLLAEYREVVEMWKAGIPMLADLTHQTFEAAITDLCDEIKLSTSGTANDKNILMKLLRLAALELSEESESEGRVA